MRMSAIQKIAEITYIMRHYNVSHMKAEVMFNYAVKQTNKEIRRKANGKVDCERSISNVLCVSR